MFQSCMQSHDPCFSVCLASEPPDAFPQLCLFLPWRPVLDDEQTWARASLVNKPARTITMTRISTNRYRHCYCTRFVLKVSIEQCRPRCAFRVLPIYISVGASPSSLFSFRHAPAYSRFTPQGERQWRVVV